jgi:hypothetical protein
MKTVIRSLLPRWFLGGFVALTGAATLLAADADLPYVSGSTGADGPLTFREIIPGGLGHAAMVYFPPSQKMILFGGQQNTGDQGGTWEWDGVNWKRLNPPNSPPSRYHHRMVYDTVREQIVLFGGYRPSSGPLNDTWVWDGQTWTEKQPATVPSARYNYTVAFDDGAGRKKTVLFGGHTGSDETWSWDGTNWSLQATATKPPGYQNCPIAYDAARNQIVMFNNQAQTWVWDGAAWSEKNPATKPPGRGNARMVYDPARQEVVMFGGDGRNDTWVWNGVNWFAKSTSPLTTRANFAMDWNAAIQRVVMFGGNTQFDSYDGDTWSWNGTDWLFVSGKRQTFDMTGRANGIWNFISINVPDGIVVTFKKNTGNTPVRWLATEQVTINGTVSVNGEAGLNSLPLGEVADGGPGGFAGGRGALRQDQSGSFVGSPGQGPGGGQPGTSMQTSPVNLRDGQNGNYSNGSEPGSYGNVFIQPLVGGSGGGGGASSETSNGSNGGGGGGAILIASSRDILVEGAITANGGDIEGSVSIGGRGSGGAILLRADRISGNGELQAWGGHQGLQNGRIRLEAYFRQLAGQTRPISVNSAPVANQDFNTLGALSVTQVAGVNVAQPPSGNTLTPDVVFTSAGAISVTVQGNNIPNGTPVRLRVTTSQQVIEAGPVDLAGNTAVFNNVNVPAGIGTIQAFAQFQLSN